MRQMIKQIEHKITGISITVVMNGKQYAMTVPQDRADQAARDIAMIYNNKVMELKLIQEQ